MIKIFLTDVYNIIEKKLPRNNALQIVEVTNSGKIFFDCVVDFCVNSGQIRRFIKYESFPLEDWMNRKILI